MDRRGWCCNMVERSWIATGKRVKSIAGRVVNVLLIRRMVRWVLLGNVVLGVIMAVSLTTIPKSSGVHFLVYLVASTADCKIWFPPRLHMFLDQTATVYVMHSSWNRYSMVARATSRCAPFWCQLIHTVVASGRFWGPQTGGIDAYGPCLRNKCISKPSSDCSSTFWNHVGKPLCVNRWLGWKIPSFLVDKSRKNCSLFVGNGCHTKNKYRLQSVPLW